MRQIAVFVMIILFLATGCSKTFIQVFDISTTNTERIDKYYVFENDTIKITYSFWASKGVMSFSIFNKTDTPIYIDWKNSSFIYNGEKKNYYIDESHTDMASYYKGVYYNGPRLELGYAVSSGVMTAASSTVKAERITFIPPKSHFSKSSFLLLPVCYYKTSNFKMNIEARSDKPKKKISKQLSILKILLSMSLHLILEIT
mgnify:CR=1 FL=1